jgi:hypothetical protein
MPVRWRRTTPLANTTHPIIAEPVANIEGSILPIVGASRRLDCNSNWVANRDSVDTRLVNQYKNNTAVLHDTEAGYGGFPSIAGGTPCTDTDHDGMPDAWETARGLNRNNAVDRNAVAASGYTNLEVYLSGTSSGTTPPQPPPPSPPPSCTQTPLNVSAASSDGGFAYKVNGSFGTPADNSANPTRSVLKLFENSLDSTHANIRNLGQGRFSHWSTTTGTGESLRFAASNNTDPRTNGRSYTYCVP